MKQTAIIAGQGALPRLIAAALDGRGEGYLVAEVEGFPSGVPGERPLRFRIERLVPFLDHLSREGVRRVVLAGALRRPKLEPELFDPRTAALVPRLLGAMQAGDDAALREVIGIFEQWDFTVVAAQEVAPELVPEPGLLAGELTDQDRDDAERAAGIAAALGRLDVGQGVVVAQGLCLAVETLPGTDAMLDFVGLNRGIRSGEFLPASGLLYKAPKPGQDRRVDLPALGPETVDRAARAGLAGIAWEAGGLLLLDRDATVAKAQENRMFLWSRPADRP
ncbi:MAG: UDP-2,3-diacylglucosamine diphosphatase LpxI [Rhodobacteraceae bacterium]|nr:UDP-2,3-diacylglucosamine diphosphatase LpxI [Paracoccaceae bacterium]